MTCFVLRASCSNLLGQLQAVRSHDGQSRGADNGGRTRYARPCNAAHSHRGRAGRGGRAGECWRGTISSRGSRLTPFVNSMPCMRMTAMAEAHTIAAELDRPPPGQQGAGQAGQKWSEKAGRTHARMGAVAPQARMAAAAAWSDAGGRRMQAWEQTAGQLKQQGSYLPVGTVPCTMICRPTGADACWPFSARCSNTPWGKIGQQRHGCS